MKSDTREPSNSRLTLVKVGRRTVVRIARRLTDRALEKIANGTYGYSDESGERISEGRLESVPEATNTLREQESADREARSS